ncbi:lysine exporter LysO family protein [Marinobacter nanhaiticus D15-8W]|uniref:Lysine exporter LysO family protein n=1 Tax=Marinobacter nanhaiticus D15-8W TaxID=626887 RepID=N6WWR9_9GAMM|nr:lysine exporter LysO family protein [Marinobacter nanhaiticus]ENO15522.1 lysine exporter LysO family protein [Marinobacter nanhaiticus D15-8W]BES73628.1 lysine exporter LysO family protein [Marinobacter nanhaiticus D15-8W]
MLASALLILVPLFVGFAIHLQNRRMLTWINHGVEGMVYLILGLLGISLGQLDGLAEQLSRMTGQVLLLVGALLVANLFGLWLWHRWQPMRLDADDQPEGSLGYRRLFLGAVRPLGAVIAGTLLGYALLPELIWIEDLASAALMLLLFLIGLQLRNAGLSLRRLLMNRQGLGIALTLAGTSLLAGLVIAPFYDLPLMDVLALASGFGWYSLSGIVVGDALGPAWGGVAFLNDVLREIIALVIIPLVIGQRPAVAIGYGGATAMDFTLPIIRRSGGLACVPVAIASGFVLSFISPVLMGLFLAG